MIESQEEKNIARYYKEDENMAELRKEDTTPDEIEQTYYGAITYHEVLDSANIAYPESIERSLIVLREVGRIQEEIEEIKKWQINPKD